MQSQTFHIGGDGGISIAAEATGNADALPVLLAHGGGQTRHAWKRVTADLANAGFRPIAIDMRGHGDSEWSAEGAYETRDFASDLVAIASKMDRKPALVGASLGGLAGLIAEGHLAPGRFASLTRVGIAPRMETGGVMRVVGFMEEHVETGFSSPDEAAEVIARYMPHRRKRGAGKGLRRYLREKEDGRYYWHWDPRFITGTQKPQGSREPERLQMAARSLKIPTLLVRGRDSDLVTVEAARQFAEIVPHSEFIDVANAGHMVAGDKNDIFTSAVLDFLTRMAPAASTS